MIDLSPMKGIGVDAQARTVRAEGGCTWRDLDHETAAFGLATTGGIIPTTGIAGLTLGGGLGWHMRKYGLSCDNLLSADVVLATGESVNASGPKIPICSGACAGVAGISAPSLAEECALIVRCRHLPVRQTLSGQQKYCSRSEP